MVARSFAAASSRQKGTNFRAGRMFLWVKISPYLLSKREKVLFKKLNGKRVMSING